MITNGTTETNFTTLLLPFSLVQKRIYLPWEIRLFSCRVKSAFCPKSAVCRLCFALTVKSQCTFIFNCFIQYSCFSKFVTLYCLRSILTYLKVTVTCDKLKLFCFNMKGVQWDKLLKSAVVIIESRVRLTAVIDLEVFVGEFTSVRWDFPLEFLSYSSNLRIKYFFVLYHHLYSNYHKLQFCKSRMKASL